MTSTMLAILCSILSLPGAWLRAPGAPFPAHGRKAAPLTTYLTEKDNGRRVPAHTGDTLDIQLPEIAGAGYRWDVESADQHIFDVQRAASIYPSQRPGSGGTAHFQIRILANGNAPLRLRYWRPWEGEAGVLKHFEITIAAAPYRIQSDNADTSRAESPEHNSLGRSPR